MLTIVYIPCRHEDARVGPGVGVAKGKSKAKPKGTKLITATTAPSNSSSSSGFASTSRSMSTTSAAAAGAEATKRKYAEPGAQKRAINVGRGRKPSDDDDNEFDDPFGDKENFITAPAEQAPPPAKKKKDRKGGIELLLAKKLDLADKAKKDPTGWWISEKCMSPRFRTRRYGHRPKPMRAGSTARMVRSPGRRS